MRCRSFYKCYTEQTNWRRKIEMMKKYVEVTINGEQKLLKFDFNAVSDVEEAFGKGIGFIFNEENVGFNVLRTFFWAGLKWKDPGMTIQRTGLLLGEAIESGEHTIESLMKAVITALQKSKLLGDTSAKTEDEGAEEGKN
jgi:hypothetical protein